MSCCCLCIECVPGAIGWRLSRALSCLRPRLTISQSHDPSSSAARTAAPFFSSSSSFLFFVAIDEAGRGESSNGSDGQHGGVWYAKAVAGDAVTTQNGGGASSGSHQHPWPMAAAGAAAAAGIAPRNNGRWTDNKLRRHHNRATSHQRSPRGPLAAAARGGWAGHGAFVVLGDRRRTTASQPSRIALR